MTTSQTWLGSVLSGFRPVSNFIYSNASTNSDEVTDEVFAANVAVPESRGSYNARNMRNNLELKLNPMSLSTLESGRRVTVPDLREDDYDLDDRDEFVRRVSCAGRLTKAACYDARKDSTQSRGSNKVESPKKELEDPERVLKRIQDQKRRRRQMFVYNYLERPSGWSPAFYHLLV